ncbi:FUSC family protein [Aliicoccus persicus]|uniref:Uncharacterized membrane protein YgaE, UPF0421/DUF939 family n=2 Tax=Aliicoccus persicus TaxID=930138 RepID=A0A662Z4N1_9STAP|nr:aromatic acid exporter family protein [Aliicoccus persicus]SEW12688.1 Uncharacterized membrane protein YgaE, UPF0421/DUF939 family [Aliicoccus persicus]
MKIGARVIKTGIAIVLTLLIIDWLGLEPGLIAAIAAVFALQPNIHRSLKRFWEQVQGNLIGAIAAVCMLLLFGNSIVVIGLTTILVLALLQVFKLQSVSTLAVVTMIAILDAPTLANSESMGDFFITAGERISLVMTGVVSALIVNLVFLPPKYESRLYHNTFNVTGDIFKWIRLEINSMTDFTIVKKDIKSIQDRIVKLETMYLYYKEERNYLKKNNFSLARKKMLYGRLLASTNLAFTLLKKLNRYQNDYNHLDEELQYRMKVEIDMLMSHHEQLFMKFNERVGPEDDYIYTTHSEEHFELTLIEMFTKLFNETKNNIDDNHYENIMSLMASIHEYRDILQNLDRITTSYFKFHAKNHELKIDDETMDI